MTHKIVKICLRFRIRNAHLPFCGTSVFVSGCAAPLKDVLWKVLEMSTWSVSDLEDVGL